MRATITANPDKVTGRIDPRIYGFLIENVGRGIYGSLWQGYGFRNDVLDASKAVRPAIIRWPGGLYADGYHWKYGVGKNRRARLNKYWLRLGPRFGTMETNQFGTDEFVEFCRIINAEPYINVNFSTGTPEEAAQWVEYANGDKSTEYGAMRATNGHPEPYGVKYWGIGNEIYGWWTMGHTKPSKYAKRCIEFAKAMKEKDENIRLIAVGAEYKFSSKSGWNREVVSIAGEYIDYLSLHLYLPMPSDTIQYYLLKMFGNRLYYSIVGSPPEAEKVLRQAASEIKEFSDKIFISFDEWNTQWYLHQILRANYSLRDGIFAAGVFNVMHRVSDSVRIACLAQLLNVIGAINTRRNDLYCAPQYYVHKLYREHAGSLAVESNVECGTFHVSRVGRIPRIKSVPVLDCSATMNEEKNRLSLMVVNRSHAGDISAEIKLGSFKPEKDAQVWEINGRKPSSRNSFRRKDEVGIEKKGCAVSSSFNYVFPAHSVTAIVMGGQLK